MYLIGGLKPSEKYESQLGWLATQYFWENAKNGNQTTNQNGCNIGLVNLVLQTKLVGGWATPLKNMKVNWDD